MKRFLVAALLLFASVCAFGQGAALVFPPATNQNGGPVVFGTITFCSVPTTINPLTGVCQTPVTVYKDQALTQPYSTIQTDGIGNFPPNFVTTTSLWFTVANTYCYTVTTTSMLSPATNPCVSFSVPIAGGSSPTFANLTVTGSLTAGAGTLASLSMGGLFDAQFFGAKGDGTTDDTAAIQSAMNACNAAGGGWVWVRPTSSGYVINRNTAGSQFGGVRGYPKCSLIGNNTKLILRANASFIYYDPSLVGTFTTATVTADTVVGQQNFTVDSSSGFSIGDVVYFRLGQNPTDAPETQYFGFANVSAIPDSTHITLDRPLNFAMTVASTQASDRQIMKSSVGFPDGIEIGGFNLFDDSANSGVAEEGVVCRFCRNVWVHNIVATDPGAGATWFQYVDNMLASNVNVLSSQAFSDVNKGRGATCAECSNVTFDNYKIANFDHHAFFVESYSNNVRVRNLQTNNDSSASQTGISEIEATQGVVMLIENWRAEGFASSSLIDYGGSTGVVYTKDLTLNTTTGANVFQTQFQNLSGNFNFVNGGASGSSIQGNYSTPRIWSGTLPLAASSTNTLTMPDGLYKRLRVYVSGTTGITTAEIVAGGIHSGNPFTGSLVAGTSVDIQVAGNTGINSSSSEASSFLTSKTLTLITDGTLVAGTYAMVQLEYYPVDDPSTKGTLNSTVPPLIQDTTNMVTSRVMAAAGSAAVPSIEVGDFVTGLFYGGTAGRLKVANGSGGSIAAFNAGGFGLASGSRYTWTNSATDPISTIDTGLSRAAADEVACGNGAASDKSCQFDATIIQLQSTVFASLGTPANGTLKYCSDCTVANPCAGSGTGALAKRFNGAWVCN